MSRKFWSQQETEFLKSNYQSFYLKELAEKLDKSVNTVENKMWRLGLELKRPSVGDRFNKLVVLDIEFDLFKNKKRYWAVCKCDCGQKTKARCHSIVNNRILSCGCYKSPKLQAQTKTLSLTHGMTNTRLYRIWANIKSRCYNIMVPSYIDYGNRGIRICNEWTNDFESFYEWATTNGYQDDLFLERIDNNGNYEPKNCKWIDQKAQNRNKRSNFLITAFNETKCLSEWIEDSRCKTSAFSVRYRIAMGWEPEQAIATPPLSKTKCFGKDQHKKNLRENIYKNIKYPKLLRTYNSMKRRCYNLNSISYQNYGMRGIVVCEEWLKDYTNFEKWSIENGYEECLTLDRINNDGNYEPNNCRWTTASEQNKNKRNNNFITAFGEKKCVTDWCNDTRCKTSRSSIVYRISKGWSSEEAITTPNKHGKL